MTTTTNIETIPTPQLVSELHERLAELVQLVGVDEACRRLQVSSLDEYCHMASELLQAIVDCDLCDKDGIVPETGVRCDHEPAAA